MSYLVKHLNTIQRHATRSAAYNAAMVLYNKHYAATGEKIRATVKEIKD